MEHIEPTGLIGQPIARIDGPEKVTGAARYGADQLVPGTAYAYLVQSGPAKGRVLRVETADAEAVAGVLSILTHGNIGRAIGSGKWFMDGGHMTTAVQPLATDRIHYSGQIVACVVAESFEAARAAAMKVRPVVEEEPAAHGIGHPDANEAEPRALGEKELVVGDFDAAFAAAPVTVDAWYETPAQHHNPMELFQCTCAWDGDALTVWESTQNVRGCQHGLAKQLGVPARKIRIVSPFIGGAFGSRGELGQHTAIVALAARRVGRPVKLVATRAQGFELRTFRAETRHHVQLGASPDGKLQALSHDGWELTSRTEPFALAGSDQTTRLYGCPNIRTSVKNIQADRQTPGFMRAPPETPYLFALESAMDELAVALGLDPLDLRRRNDTQVDPIKGVPYTSRSLLECIDVGAEAFGWEVRDPRPCTMRDGDELVGYGYASAFYPTQMGPADGKVTLTPDLRAIVEVGTHEIGTGIRTVLAQLAADLLGLPVDRVEVRIGDSKLPATPLAAGSNTTATVCTVIGQACVTIRRRIAEAAVKNRTSTLSGGNPELVVLRGGEAAIGSTVEPLGLAVRRANRGKPLVETATNNPHGSYPLIGPSLIRRGKLILVGGSRLKDRLQFAFGAQFVEVRVDRHTGQIRVPRMIGAFAGGRIMNRRTAAAQLAGGMLWGMSAALHEETVIDKRRARYMNANLAEYHIPVNADVERIEAHIVDEVDTQVNPLGIKGVGELGTTGMNAAIANAVFHATGKRVRRTPIRVEDVV